MHTFPKALPRIGRCPSARRDPLTIRMAFCGVPDGVS